MCASERTRVWKAYLPSVEKRCVVQLLFVVFVVMYFTGQPSAKCALLCAALGICVLWGYVITIKTSKVLPAICNSPWQMFSSKMAFVLWSLSLSLLLDLWGKPPALFSFTAQGQCGWMHLGAAAPSFVPEGQHSWVKHCRWGCTVAEARGRWRDKNHGGLCAPSSHSGAAVPSFWAVAIPGAQGWKNCVKQ